MLADIKDERDAQIEGFILFLDLRIKLLTPERFIGIRGFGYSMAVVQNMRGEVSGESGIKRCSVQWKPLLYKTLINSNYTDIVNKWHF